MYQRIVIVTFKDELSKASMTSIIKQQGEAYKVDAKIVDALRKAGAKVETKEGLVERAWFNGIDDIGAVVRGSMEVACRGRYEVAD